MKTKHTPFEDLRIYFRLVLRNETPPQESGFDKPKTKSKTKLVTFRKARRTVPKPAPRKKETGIIYCVVSAHGKIRAPFSTGHSLHRDSFDFRKKEVIQTNDLTKSIHADLERIKSELIRLNSQLRQANKPVNAFILVDTYTGKVRDQHRVLALQNDWFANEKAKKQKKFNTFRHHVSMLKHMSTFLKDSPDYPLHKVNLQFCENFYQFLKSKVGVQRANRVISFHKRIFHYALMRDMIEVNYFEGVERQTVKQKAPEYLTIEQVNSIADYAFSPDMQIVADIFLLACYTGLYYSDIMELDKSIHRVERYGLLIIQKNRFKIDQPCFIPILPEANLILDKYNWNVQTGSNKRQDKANTFLKSVFEVCGLPLHYSFRTGRKTFLTTMLNEYEFTAESVSYMAGHLDKNTLTKHYARVNEKRVIQETKEILERRLKPANVRSFEAIKEKKA